MINKFRAYRKEYGMTEPFTLGNLQDQKQFDFLDGGYLSWDEFGLEHEDTVVMRYTGLKDKNGMEIYEGDILKISLPGNGGHYPILWYDHAFWIDQNGQYDLPNKEWREIIGNIHENPEVPNVV